MATNKRRFTEQMIERLRPPKQGRLEFGDNVVPGLVLRVTPRGTKSFSVIYKVRGEGGVSPRGRLLAGKQHRITLGNWPLLGLGAARESARSLLEVITEGRDPRAELREANLLRIANTVENVMRRFIEQDARRNVASWKKIERCLELHVLPEFGALPICDVRRVAVHQLLDQLISEGKWARHGRCANTFPACSIGRWTGRLLLTIPFMGWSGTIWRRKMKQVATSLTMSSARSGLRRVSSAIPLGRCIDCCC